MPDRVSVDELTSAADRTGRAAALLLAVLLAGCQRNPPPVVSSPVNNSAPVSPRLIDQHGPVDGALIQAIGGKVVATSDHQGRFELPADSPEVLCAYKQGYLLKRVDTGAAPGDIEMQRLPEEDNPDYQWVDPTPDPKRETSCGNCHREIYDQWSAGAHSRSAVNERFLDLYDGGDDESWSLLHDHPAGAGVCQSCHAPSISADNLSDDIRAIGDVARQGVHCDFCHKAYDTVDESQLGLAHGQYALRLLRPSHGQVIFGPRRDAIGPDNAWAAAQSTSRYCAACHEGTVFGVPVYTTFSEWKASPAAQQGRSCQSCHMAPNHSTTNTAPGFGGPERPPGDIASHDLLPGGLRAMLQSCLQVEVKTSQAEAGWRVEVVVTADNVGHAVPTGFIDHHLLLSVTAVNAAGEIVPPASGPLLSHVAGESKSGSGGLLFARQLVGRDGTTPSPFWKPVSRTIDTRLQPQQPQSGEWTFPQQPLTIDVELVHRRFWRPVARAKGWPDDDIVVKRESLILGDGDGFDPSVGSTER